MFVPNYPTEGLTGAEYNPRKITPECEADLRQSISEVGFVKPILVTEAGRIVAGHQRTNAARLLGMTTVPAYIIKSLELVHEMVFNQLHNGADIDEGDPQVRIPPSTAEGFQDVPPEGIDGAFKQPGAAMRNEIYRLICRYGNWGAVVATQSGEVLSSHQYALACKQAARPLRVFFVPEEKRPAVLRWFTKQYGVFCYDRLPKQTYLQAHAQPSRNKKGEGSTDGEADEIQSATYDLIRPTLRKTERLLDFGCGFGQILAELQRGGFRALGVEFFYKGNSHSIKPHAVHQMVEDVCTDLERNGLFDIVVCDSVINSVDSVAAENNVLACLNAFCRRGGRIIFSGRSKRDFAKASSYYRSSAAQTDFQLLDEDGFSALPRGGQWLFQKYHSKVEAFALATRTIGPAAKLIYQPGRWQAHGQKTIELSADVCRAAIAAEFDLPWPEGRRVGKAERALRAWDTARAKDRNAELVVSAPRKEEAEPSVSAGQGRDVEAP